MSKIRLPLKEEYVKAGYKASDYNKFLEARTKEAEKNGDEVEIRDATPEEIAAGAAKTGGPIPPVVVPRAPHENMNFPKQPHELKGTAQAAILSNWALQSKSGLITLCNATEGQKEGDRSCYYPLVPKRDAKRDGQPLQVTRAGGRVGFVAYCSYDPDGHGEQTIFPPKKDDEI